MNALWSLLALLGCLVGPAATLPGSRVEIQLDRERFETTTGLAVGCHLHSYSETGPWRLVLPLPSNGFVPRTSVWQVMSTDIRDSAACKRIAALANKTHHRISGETTRRVFDTHRMIGEHCVRLMEEEFELTIDGTHVPLRGSVTFRIGERPMKECEAR